MSLFAEALAAARRAVKDTYGVPMMVMAMAARGDFKPPAADPMRPPLACIGVLHEHATSMRADETVIERSDGGHPGDKFGIDLAAAPTRISFDVDDLAGRVPPEGTLIAVPSLGRTFRVSFAGPQNAGRVFLYVTEVAP